MCTYRALIKQTTLTLTAWSLLLFMGCGGGGSSDTCNDSVACIGPDPKTLVDSSALLGSYNIRYTLSENSCTNANPLQTLNESYQVTSGVGYHGIPTLEVVSDNGLNYSTFSTVGNTDGVSSFQTYETGQQKLAHFVAGMDCYEVLTLNFSNVSSKSVSVERISDITCGGIDEVFVLGGPGSCQVIYRGIGSFSQAS